jgi:hypothetical protein
MVALLGCKHSNSTQLASESSNKSTYASPLILFDIRSAFATGFHQEVMREHHRTGNGYTYQGADLKIERFDAPPQDAEKWRNRVQIPIILDIWGGGQGSETKFLTTGGATVRVTGQLQSRLIIDGGSPNQEGKLSYEKPYWTAEPDYSYSTYSRGLFRRIANREAVANARQQGNEAVVQMRNTAPPEFEKQLSKAIATYQSDFNNYSKLANSVAGLSELRLASSSSMARGVYFSRRSVDAPAKVPSRVDLPPDKAIGIAVHEKAIGEISHANLSGKTIPIEQLRDQICQMFRAHFEQLCAAEPYQSPFEYSLVFGDDPITSRFDDRQIWLIIRARLKVALATSQSPAAEFVSPVVKAAVLYRQNGAEFLFERTEIEFDQLQSQKWEEFSKSFLGSALEMAGTVALDQVKRELEASIRGSFANVFRLPHLPAVLRPSTLVIKDKTRDVGVDDSWLHVWYSVQ